MCLKKQKYNSRQQKTIALRAMVFEKLRGLDSNQRPPGYEPDELPLLYPALGVPFGILSERVLYPSHWEASRIEIYLQAIEIHNPANPVIILADT